MVDVSGVRILTVHKSKGLEFEHVIVMDRLKKAPPARDSIIYEYEGIKLQNLYLRMKGRDLLDKAYAKALEKEKALAIEDSLNALYVAFTRAKESLYVMAKEEGSLFDILELENASYGNFVVMEKEKREEKTYLPFTYKSLYYGTQSKILEYEESNEEDLEAIEFGLAMHYALEMMPKFDHKSLVHAMNLVKSRYAASLKEEQLRSIEKRLCLLVANEEFLALTEGRVYKEKALKYKNSVKYIDLLVEQNNQAKDQLFGERIWHVIDYKSSMAYTQEHHIQVKTYVKAIEEITLDKVDGYICYLLEDGIKLVKV